MASILSDSFRSFLQQHGIFVDFDNSSDRCLKLVSNKGSLEIWAEPAERGLPFLYVDNIKVKDA